MDLVEHIVNFFCSLVPFHLQNHTPSNHFAIAIDFRLKGSYNGFFQLCYFSPWCCVTFQAHGVIYKKSLRGEAWLNNLGYKFTFIWTEIWLLPKLEWIILLLWISVSRGQIMKFSYCTGITHHMRRWWRNWSGRALIRLRGHKPDFSKII